MNTPIKLEVKPLSVNNAFSVYKGKKLKTKQYRQYEKTIIAHLIKSKIKLKLPPNGDLYLYLKIGVSRAFDTDNAAKPLIDIFQGYFGFNDNRITYLVIEKDVVKRGNEYIEFQLSPRFIEAERPYLDQKGFK